MRRSAKSAKSFVSITRMHAMDSRRLCFKGLVSYPKEELQQGCLVRYQKEKADGTELPTIIGLLRDHVEREEERFRAEQERYQRCVAALLTPLAVTGGVYVAIVLDAWSRRVVGYAISRSIDARLTLAALQSAIEGRNPPPGCLHHSDRGSQYAAGAYRQFLAANGLVGSMGRRGNPYDNAKAESFMKTLKVEGVYPIDLETFADVVEHLPRFIDQIYNSRRLHSALGYLSPVHFEDQHVRLMVRELT
ncbi:IS3 family transposase [Rhizobium mongolense]|uniref:IS3 family transposase n=1 Tax=Rhizobium mongolense TaxID=57676 RepID=UPI0034A1EBE7